MVLILYKNLFNFLKQNNYVDTINNILWNNNIELKPNISFYRIKSLTSIKNKMKKYNFKNYDDIEDLLGIRYIYLNEEHVEQSINYIKNTFKNKNTNTNTNTYPFSIIKNKDYILNPKPNGYKAYHICMKLINNNNNINNNNINNNNINNRLIKLNYISIEIQILSMTMYLYNLEGPPKLYYKNKYNDII